MFFQYLSHFRVANCSLSFTWACPLELAVSITHAAPTLWSHLDFQLQSQLARFLDKRSLVGREGVKLPHTDHRLPRIHPHNSSRSCWTSRIQICQSTTSLILFRRNWALTSQWGPHLKPYAIEGELQIWKSARNRESKCCLQTFLLLLLHLRPRKVTCTLVYTFQRQNPLFPRLSTQKLSSYGLSR